VALVSDSPHILVVRFGNNDYAEAFRKACEDFLQAVVDGERGWSLEKLQELLKEGTVEDLAHGLAMAAWGYTIVHDGTYALRALRRLGRLEKPLELYLRIEDRRKFMMEATVTASCEEFVSKWENSEVCYIDFENCKVHLQ
jgi:hypothetical protein